MKKLKIKVCGLTLLNDVKFCIQQNIDFLGFNFYPKSKRYISFENFSSILANIKKNNSFIVGVFVNFSADDIINIYNNYNLDYVQLHSDEDLQFCKKLKENSIKIIKVFRIDKFIDYDYINTFNEVSDFFLFDKKDDNFFGGTGKSFDFKILNKKKINKEFFIAGGIGLDNFIEAINITNADGIDLNSKIEISAGVKDLEKIKKILQIKKSYF